MDRDDLGAHMKRQIEKHGADYDALARDSIPVSEAGTSAGAGETGDRVGMESHFEALRPDEAFTPATTPEAMLQQRLAEARATIASATITCDADLSRNCDDGATCDGCGHPVFIHLTGVAR